MYPYIGLIYGRYLHFRILKFPLNMCQIQRVFLLIHFWELGDDTSHHEILMQERWQRRPKLAEPTSTGKHEWKWYIHCFVHYLIIYPINKETFAVPGLFPDLKRWSTLLPLGESQRLNLALTYYYDEAGDCWKDPHDQENKSAAWWNMMNYSHHPNTVLNTPQMVPIMWIFPSKPWFLRGCLILGVRDYKGFATLHVSCKRYA